MHEKTALIIVHLNNDFMDDGALPVKGADQIVRPIDELAASQRYDYVIATQDWHHKNHCSFKIWPPHCVAGTPGAEINAELKMAHIDALLKTGFDNDADSYSGFYNEHGKSNGLTELLRARDVQQVDIVGVATDYCVKHTAIDAAQKAGFKTRVLLEFCKGIGLEAEDIPNAINEMRHAGVEIVN